LFLITKESDTVSIGQVAVARSKIPPVIKGSQFPRDVLKSPLTMSRKGEIRERFGQKPNETLEIWLHQVVDKKATPVPPDENEWKSTCHLMTNPMLFRHPGHEHKFLR